MSNKAVSPRSIRRIQAAPQSSLPFGEEAKPGFRTKNSRHAADSRANFAEIETAAEGAGQALSEWLRATALQRRAAASRRPCGTGVGRGLGGTLCPPESLPCWRSSGIGRQANVARFHPQNPRRSRCAQAATGS